MCPCVLAALKYDQSNVRYLWERSSLYEQVGEHKQAMDGYRRILTLLPPTDGEHFMQLSRDMAKYVTQLRLGYKLVPGTAFRSNVCL